MTRLGLCCLLVGPEKTKFRTLRLQRTKQLANQQAAIREVYQHNLDELVRVLRYLEHHKILHYRVSSDMFPLADHEDFEAIWNQFCDDDNSWARARAQVAHFLARDGRLSTHPGQFCLISSNNPIVNERGIKTLEYHAKMFDMLGIPRSYFCPINIHVSNGNQRDAAGDMTNSNYEKLSESVTKRLVFETEDKSFWTYQQLARHFDHVPITLDYHHRLINNEQETEQQAHDFCVTTWQGVKPLFHHSEGRAHRLDRAHSDFIKTLPSCAVNVDVEIEAKQKNLAVLELIKSQNLIGTNC